MDKPKITVRKAEGTPRGWGWYWLLNGTHDGREMVDVGGEDWYPSEKAAREAAKLFVQRCEYSQQWGWITK